MPEKVRLSFPLAGLSIGQSTCQMIHIFPPIIRTMDSIQIKCQLSSSKLTVTPYLSALLAFSISLFLFQMARLLMRYRYSSKVISFSRPSAVFSSPSNNTTISCSSFRMIYCSVGLLVCFSTSIFDLTNSSSRVSSTVTLQCPGLQYIRNWVRWKRFLLSAVALSMVHRLYMLMNSFRDIFLSRFSSNSHSMRSMSAFPILIPIFRSTSRTSPSVKYLCLCFSDSASNTCSRYFSSLELILNSSSFSSMVFSFSTLRCFSFDMLNSNLFQGCSFYFWNTTEFLYFFWRCGGRSRNLMVFFYSFIGQIISACSIHTTIIE